MKPALLATMIASILVAASVAGVVTYDALAEDDAPLQLFSERSPAGADEARVAHGTAGDGHDHVGMQRPSWPEAVGTTPSAEDAQSMEQVSRIIIRDDHGFAPANGVRSGNGTLDDPYVISGYYVTGDLYIADTDACFIVAENYIAGQLTLNWNGQCVWAHHNYIEDLRVNENVRREGYATGGLLELNKIEFIGQIRHYDGEFRHNIVGPRLPSSMFDEVMETTPLLAPELLVANVDGFNQGYFHHNTFYGSVDLDLHGHHHGTGFFAPHSHYHGSNMTKGMAMEHDHTMRWTSVAFTDNKIVDEEGYGLRYEDRNHRGDDRTASSEQVEELEMPHKHFTKIELLRNEIEGGGIWVDVFNADDENHYTRNPGSLDIIENTVRYQERDPEYFLGLFAFQAGPFVPAALYAETVKEVELTVRGNQFELLPDAGEDGGSDPLYTDAPLFSPEDPEPSAIYLARFHDANLTIEDNLMSGFYYGIAAGDFAEDVDWTVEDNDFGEAQYPVYYDESVKSQPDGSDAP